MKTKLGVGIIAFFFLITQHTGKAYGQSTNYKSQALFIYNFIKYTTWPSQSTDFTITVLGASPLTNELQQLAAARKTPSGQKIIINQTSEVTNLANCQLLYITDAKSKEIETVITLIKEEPILVIGQRDGLVKKGAAISFFTNDEGGLGFEMSRKTLKLRNIKMASELSHFAELVD